MRGMVVPRHPVSSHGYVSDVPINAGFANKRQPIFWDQTYVTTREHVQQQQHLQDPRNVYNNLVHYAPGFTYILPTSEPVPGYNLDDKLGGRPSHLSSHVLGSTGTWENVGLRQEYSNSTQFGPVNSSGYAVPISKLETRNSSGYAVPISKLETRNSNGYAAVPITKLQNSTRRPRCFCEYGWNSGLMNQTPPQNKAPLVRNPTVSSLNQLTTPLTVDTSLEYEVSHSVSLPKDSAPLLLIQETGLARNNPTKDHVSGQAGHQSSENNPSQSQEPGLSGRSWPGATTELSEIMGLNKENIGNKGDMFGSHQQTQQEPPRENNNPLKRKRTQDNCDVMSKRPSLVQASLHNSLTPPDLLSSSSKFFDGGTKVSFDSSSQIPSGISQFPVTSRRPSFNYSETWAVAAWNWPGRVVSHPPNLSVC